MSAKDEDKSSLPCEIEFSHINTDEIDNISLIDFLVQRFKKYGERIAIEMENGEYSYAYILQQGIKVASSIINELNVTEGTVGILFDFKPDMIIAIIGAILSGRTFVCIDSNEPIERIAYLLNDANIKVVLCDDTLESRLNNKKEQTDDIKLLLYSTVSNYDVCDYIAPDIKGTETALLLYTSGSTGKPKGVKQSYRNLLFHIASYQNSMKINSNDRVALLTPYTHSVAYIDILSTFFAGGVILPYNVWSSNNADYLSEWINNKGITIYHSVPTLFRYIVIHSDEKLKWDKVRLVVLGGESVNSVDWTLYRRICDPKCIFVNFYGCSEVMTASFFFLDMNNPPKTNLIPIGYFIPGVNIEIEHTDNSENQNEGEIIYKSRYITSGYWNNDEIDDDRFSFDEEKDIISFRSGDLGRKMLDGHYELIGRNDGMVKINGKRIDLAEIEANLIGLLDIDKCVAAIVKTEYADKILVAFYTTYSCTQLDEKKVFGVLRQILPNYMIPSKLLFLEQFPIMQNGKIDRKKIISENSFDVESDGVIYTKSQKAIIELWRKILNVNAISLKSHFLFLGGNSLHLLSLAEEIRQTYGINIDIKDLIDHMTVEEMADLFETKASQAVDTSDCNKNVVTVTGKNEAIKFIPLNNGQHRVYIHSLKSNSCKAYNQTTMYRISGVINIEKANRSLNELIKRHVMLRAALADNGDELRFKVNECTKAEVEEYSCSEDEVNSVIGKFVREFDLHTPPLMRLGYINIDDQKGILVMDIHHLISDGTSVNILFNEFIALYNGAILTTEEDISLFCISDERYDSDDLSNKQITYWRDKMNQPIETYSFFNEDKEPNELTETVTIVLDEVQNEKINSTASSNNITVFSLLLSAYFILLYRYHPQENIVVSVPFAGRNSNMPSNSVGMFINMLPIVCHFEDNMSVGQVMSLVANNVVEAIQNKDVPFENIVEILQEASNTNVADVFNLMFVFQNMENQMMELDGMQLSRMDSAQNNTAYDMAVEAIVEGTELHIQAKYNTDTVKYRFVKDFMNHFRNVINVITADDSCCINDFELLSDSDREYVLGFNSTDNDYVKDLTTDQLFERYAEQHRDLRAVIENKRVYTYGEVNDRANMLAVYLIESGCKENQVIAVLLKRSIHMLVAIMAIHKIGATYLPIEPDYPQSRKAYMLEDSNCCLVLTDSESKNDIDTSLQVVEIDTLELKHQGKNSISVNKLGNIAYLIYTSGTTGLPKAVAVKQSSLVNLFCWMKKEFLFSEDSNILMKTPFVFDVSTSELLWWGMYGATVTILPPGDEKKPKEIVSSIYENKVTHINFVPSMLNAFLMFLESSPEEIEKCNSLKYVICAGEPLTYSLVTRFYSLFNNTNTVLYNLYGPTETTVYVTYYKCDSDNIPHSIPIGYPLDNCRAYILNPMNRIQPVGTVGELCISGDCLSDGYYNKVELTNNSFVKNPYEENLMYRTGDLACWLPNGEIQCLGRIDNQVKIRGYRIELEEIRRYLIEIEEIKEAIVLVCTDKAGDKFICAYCLFNEVMTMADIKEKLARNLPDYMIPAAFVSIEEIPTNTNGKLAIKLLPEPITNIEIGNEYFEAVTEVEKALVDVWKSVLGIEKISISDGFLSIGGNSIKAMQVQAYLKKKYHLEIPLEQLFGNKNIKDISRSISQCEDKSVIRKVEEKTYYPLSSAQKRIYFSSLLKGNEADDNNAVMAFIISGDIKTDKLRETFKKIIRRHEILRTTYHVINGEVRQKVEEDFDFEIEERRVDNNETVEEIFGKFNSSFDLTKAPVLKTMVVYKNEEESILFIVVHHIAFDGFSRNILIRELAELYNGNSLEELNLQYKDYANWQCANLDSQNMKKQEEYWCDQFKKYEEQRELFLDYTRPKNIEYTGASVTFTVPEDIGKRLDSIVERTGVSKFHIMFSAYCILLNRYSESIDINVGIPEFGRNNKDVDKMIGMFVNTLVIRTQPQNEKRVLSYMKEVADTMIDAIKNNEYPYDLLVKKLGINIDGGRNPLFDTMFAYQNIETDILALNGVKAEYYNMVDNASIFDIVMYIYVGKFIEGKVTYSSKLYKNETIEQLIKDYFYVIEQIDENDNITIGEVMTLKKKELADELRKNVFEFAF